MWAISIYRFWSKFSNAYDAAAWAINSPGDKRQFKLILDHLSSIPRS